jgi:hypothetical protein
VQQLVHYKCPIQNIQVTRARPSSETLFSLAVKLIIIKLASQLVKDSTDIHIAIEGSDTGVAIIGSIVF